MFMLVFGVAAALAQEVHRVPTADGAEIVLEHHATAGGPPVVLCHGISSNHFFWDLEPGRSLALYLQERGYDVWNMDLRGHGSAEVDGAGKKQRPGWTVGSGSGPSRLEPVFWLQPKPVLKKKMIAMPRIGRRRLMNRSASNSITIPVPPALSLAAKEGHA